jgi:hypothetical protein
MKRRDAMNLRNDLGNEQIQNVIKNHPRIGEILNRYEIGCVTCGVGICLLKDVVSIHALGEEAEQRIEAEINEYLETAASAA